MIPFLTILIPAYNEESSIIQTLNDYSKFFPFAHFIIIDNNSSDKTHEIVSNFISNNNKIKIELFSEVTQGKASAIKSALMKRRSSWWIMTDADNTYPAEDMSILFEHVRSTKLNHGVLDRLTKNSYTNKGRIKTFIHYLGNTFFSKILSMITGNNFCDVFSGGRVFSQPFIETLVINSKGFELETEINIHASTLGIKTYEHPSSYRNRPEDSESKLSPFYDGLKILKFTFVWLLNRRSDLILLILGLISFFIGMALAIFLVDVYIELGRVPYPSTAVASALFILTGLQLMFFGLSFRYQRYSLQTSLRLKFNEIHREWYQSQPNDYQKDIH
jgi:glycosyltransferase involved in cell wall biosynthesis